MDVSFFLQCHTFRNGWMKKRIRAKNFCVDGDRFEDPHASACLQPLCRSFK